MIPVNKILIFFLCLGLLNACKTEPAKKETEEKTTTAGTPVTVVSPERGTMQDVVGLNAVSSFLLKSSVKANANGYLQLVNSQLGRYVSKGQILFVIKTKESQNLGNTINALDTSLHFTGIISIRTPGSGYITRLNYHSGDYVQDGEPLATITDTKSFVFLLDLPYELKPYLPENREVRLQLPDGSVLNGHLGAAMPAMDLVSQTQNYIIKVNTASPVPENLIARVNWIKETKINTLSLPKAAVLSDEMQSRVWIMKLTDSVTAVKVPVQKGLETGDRVEILSPGLSVTDKILLTGNYGLPDTAKVTIVK
jgi:hypothetical protein